MNVSEKKAKIWRKDYQGKNGEFYRYSVSISKKNEDGKYVNAYLPIKFSKKADAPEKIENGTVCAFEGFMSVESFKDKDGNERNQPMIIAMSVQFEDDSFEQMEEDIPF